MKLLILKISLSSVSLNIFRCFGKKDAAYKEMEKIMMIDLDMMLKYKWPSVQDC